LIDTSTLFLIPFVSAMPWHNSQLTLDHRGKEEGTWLCKQPLLSNY
jgi:hypothetical protein